MAAPKTGLNADNFHHGQADIPHAADNVDGILYPRHKLVAGGGGAVFDISGSRGLPVDSRGIMGEILDELKIMNTHLAMINNTVIDKVI